MHPAENNSNGSLLHERLEQFVNLNVVKYYGCSINEFLDLPSDVVAKMLEICAKRQKLDSDSATNLLDKLDR